MPAQDDFQDELIRRQVELLRFSSGLTERVLKAIDSSEQALVDLIRERLDAIGPGGRTASDVKLARLKGMLKDVREIRRQALTQATGVARAELGDLVQDETAFLQGALGRSIPILEIAIDVPARVNVRAATFGTPFGGRRFSEWFKGLEQGDATRLEGAIRAGFLEGEGIDSIVRRVRGTRPLGGADGITEITRNQARTLVRTAVNHMTNAARDEMFATNDDIILALRWSSVLDGRTSAICRARDGRIAPVKGREIPVSLSDQPRLKPPEARPPAHPNCRSQMVAILSEDGIVGKRPFVTDTRTRATREVDFRKIARQTGKPIKDVRAEWARENIGRTPARTTYQEWLRRQSAKFQDEVLGPTRGKLFRRGDLTLDRFVDRTGRQYTLDELRLRDPAAFQRARIEP